MNNKSLSTSLVTVLQAIILAAVCLVEADDGIAVSIAYRYSAQCKYCPSNERPVPERSVYDHTFWGKLVRYTIKDNKTAAVDTLLDVLAYYPAISIDGTSIAVFLNGSRINKNDDLEKNAIDPGLYICDINGNNLNKVLDYTDFGKNNAVFLDWPAGDWVYYHNKAQSEGEIWRVNIQSGANQKVFDYIPPSATSKRSDLRRWSCNAAASYAITHNTDLFNKHAHCFPPPEKDPESCKSGIVKDCNLSIGASGHYSASYYGVGHNFIDLHYLKMQPGHSEHFARITVEEAAEWAGKGSVGKGAEWIRWSCNSDKWVLQQIGWKGHANRLDVSGSNAVYINWVDEDAIMVTDNPKNNDEGQNSISHCNTAGDFWVQPPPGKEGMIQLKDGSWVPVLEKTTIHEASQTPLQHPKGISVSGNRLLVPAAALGDGHTAVSLFTINGTKVRRTIASRTGAVVDIQGLAGGAYMLKARGRGGDHVWRITLSR